MASKNFKQALDLTVSSPESAFRNMPQIPMPSQGKYQPQSKLPRRGYRKLIIRSQRFVIFLLLLGYNFEYCLLIFWCLIL